MADISKIKLPNGSEYDIKDTISGYVASTTTARIFVQSSEPSSSSDGDIWIEISGGGGGGTLTVATATATPSSASSSISFSGLNGEPTSFAIVSASNLATGASPYKTAIVVYDGTNVIGDKITNTSNAQMTYDGSGFS